MREDRREARGRRRRRPTTAIAAALAAATLVAVGIVLLASPGETRATTRYVAMGDSYAVGIGATTPRGGYVARVAGWLRAQGVDDVDNVAVGGETTASLVADGQLDRALDAIDDSGSTTRMATVDIGVNELFVPECSKGAWQLTCGARDDLRRLFGALGPALRADDRRGRLVVIGLYVPFPTAPAGARAGVDVLLQGTDRRVDCAGRGDAIGFNDLLACLSCREGATFVGTRSTFAARPTELISSDGLHPSDAGHAAIAELVERAVRHPVRVRNCGALR